MRLLTIRSGTETAAHVEIGDGVSPIVGTDGRTYHDVRAVLEAGDQGLSDARRALETTPVPVDRAQIARPILDPGAVVCVGLNYRTHILEMGRELPDVPTLFSKLPRALTDPYAPVTIPGYSSKLDYEGEFGAVIGRGGRDIPVAEAWNAVAGLTVVNDVSARDHQWRSAQWFAGKTGEAMTPVGPVVVTMDELEDGLDELAMRVHVNGELRQNAVLGDLVFDIAQLVSDLSHVVCLRPGDIIATGTPGGVAAGMESPAWITPGDVVEVSIDRIGTLRNEFVAPSSAVPVGVAGLGSEA